MGDPFAYRYHVENELHHHREIESRRILSRQTEYDWHGLDNGKKPEKEIYTTGCLHNVWNNPGKSTKGKYQHEGREGKLP